MLEEQRRVSVYLHQSTQDEVSVSLSLFFLSTHLSLPSFFPSPPPSLLPFYFSSFSYTPSLPLTFSSLLPFPSPSFLSASSPFSPPPSLFISFSLSLPLILSLSPPSHRSQLASTCEKVLVQHYLEVFLSEFNSLLHNERDDGKSLAHCTHVHVHVYTCTLKTH